jgi:uncharacterized membrane protein YphA (DoxX/SURF4 family)
MNIARIAPIVARVLLGLCFFVFGLNGFLNFLPKPAEAPPERVAAFMGGLIQTGYMFQLIKGTEVLGGLLLLANRFVPLGLALLAPVVVNIVLFHVLLAPPPNPITALVFFGEVYLAWAYRDAFRPMLAARVQPSGAAAAQPENQKARATA